MIRLILSAIATGCFVWLMVTQHRLWPTCLVAFPMWFALGYQYCLEKMQKNHDS
jgi:hypothetical protein